MESIASEPAGKLAYLFTLLYLSLLGGCSLNPFDNDNSGTFTDSRDRHQYAWVRIGAQVWMAENLAYLPEVNPPTEVSSLSPIYYVYGYEGNRVEEAQVAEEFTRTGVLYNWVAANKACPRGWRLASDEDWKVLEQNLGMAESEVNSISLRNSGGVGKMLKSVNGWYDNGNGNNSSRFNALPGGYHYSYGGFNGKSYDADFWTSTLSDSTHAWGRNLYHYSDGVRRSVYYTGQGYSVRCIRGK